MVFSRFVDSTNRLFLLRPAWAHKRPDFWDLGSAAPWQFAVVTEIVNYVCWIGSQFGVEGDRRALFVPGLERIGLHEHALLARLLDGSEEMPGLRRLAGVKVLQDHEDLARRDLILAISIDGLEHTQAVREYEKRGVIVYERVASSIYSRRMLESFNLDGAVRVSPLHCHTFEDIDRFRESRRTSPRHSRLNRQGPQRYRPDH